MKLRKLIIGISLISLILTGCTIGDTQFVLDVNNVGRNDVFSINGTECSIKEAKLYLCNYQNLYGKEFGIDLWNHDFGEHAPEISLETYVKDVTLAQLANILCMNMLAEDREIELSEGEHKKAEAAAEEYFSSLNKKEISYMDIDRKKVQECYEKYAIAQKLYDTLTQGINEEVSEDEARVMRIQQIFVTSTENANAVQQKLQEGNDFATVAAAYNEAPEIEITMARNAYPKAIEDIAFQLDNGQLSEMITTEEGYYFLKCISKYEQELTEENKAAILVQRRKEQFDDVLTTFVENSSYELNEDLWEEVKPDISGTIQTDSFFEVYEKHFK
uniref:peptidylprolyl isomerase n=1 Tax=Agathobacter sp. TaxID=2021311 RepID=UPI004057C94F